MTKQKVLVTGASGLVGGLVLRGLSDRYEFSGLSRHAVDGIPYTVAPVTDLAAVRRAVEGMDMVLHLAGETKNDDNWDDHFNVTAGGTINVLRAAAEAGVQRTVLMSTGSTMCGWEWDDSLPYGRLAAGERDMPAWDLLDYTDAATTGQPLRCGKAVRRGRGALVLRSHVDERADHPAGSGARGEPADADPALPGIPRPGGRRPDDRSLPVGATRPSASGSSMPSRRTARDGGTRRRRRRSSAGARRGRPIGSTPPS